jgi:hypothetical protein
VVAEVELDNLVYPEQEALVAAGMDHLQHQYQVATALQTPELVAAVAAVAVLTEITHKAALAAPAS